METTEEKKVGVRSLVCNISRVEGRVGAMGWGLGQVTSKSIIHTNLHKPNNKLVSAWLEHFWCTDKPRAYTNSPRPGLGGSHHLPPIVFSMPNHGACIQMSFCSKFFEIGTFATLKARNFLCKPLIEMKSKAK
jgi:hypothetical protein